jgi:predicted MFS family arabinose efflux permease
LMGISAVIVAMAPNYLTYIVGRALLGVVIGGFWSMSAAVAIRLVPPDQVPKALGIFNGGNALAMVIAAPLGSQLGAVIGWRGAFFALVPVALFAWVWLWVALPNLPADDHVAASGRVLKLLKGRAVACGLAGCGAFFMGQFALFTYLRPFLETTTQVSVSTLSLLLLEMGVAGFIGTLAIGAVLKRGVYGPLIAAPLLLSLIAVALIPLGAWLAPVAVLLGLWGLIATGVPVGWWNWVAQTLPNDAEAGGGLMVAVIQFAIALGATLGGALFDATGHRGTFVVSALLLWLAALLTFQSARAQAAQNIQTT